jgi:hypothetical protein
LKDEIGWLICYIAGYFAGIMADWGEWQKKSEVLLKMYRIVNN